MIRKEDLSSLLLSAELPSPKSRVTHETRERIGRLVGEQQSSSTAPIPFSAHSTVVHAGTGAAAHPSWVVPMLLALRDQILNELESNLPKLLSLNPSRRESIACHLDYLAGVSPAHGTPEAGDAGQRLRRWVTGPKSPSQTLALRSYFAEIAVIVLGQCVVLKAWADRGIRPWTKGDLGKLNWALNRALKPHLPLDRECWQLTRANLYSWYTPSPAIQDGVWSALEGWRITDEGRGFFMSLLLPLRRGFSKSLEPQGYDTRFFGSIWESLKTFGFDPTTDSSPLKRVRRVFSPTLRDGAIVRSAPGSLSWVGLETSTFQLLIAELGQIWWGPAAPPLWSVGTGLEVHARDQLTLSLGSPKPSLLSRIAEMEACDLAIVLEEKTIRTQGRSAEAHRFREQLEALPYFKKLRSAGTSLGDLQACVALSKLRPGGLLWWSREEPLTSSDGSEVLNYLLERAQLLCEWDYTGLEHSLPSSVQVFPKHLYVFQREPGIEARLSHRPLRISLEGQIRSHVELPPMFEDALLTYSRNPEPRGHWRILRHQSPTSQKDWAERWPDPTSQDILRDLEKLQNDSLPLAGVTTVRPTPEGNSTRESFWSVNQNLRGFWVEACSGPQGRTLVTHALPRPGRETQGTGFLVLVSDETWVAPLAAFLGSSVIHNWLEHHAERKGNRWVLNDQVMRFIPIPKALLKALGHPVDKEPGDFPARPLPGDWEKLASDVAYNPKVVRETLSGVEEGELGCEIRASIFVRAARALDYLQSGQNKLFSMVSEDGRILWRELLDILPKAECVAVPLHPGIRMSGNIPPHLPIARIERVKAPLPGVFLATESGFHLHLASESPLLLDMVSEQLEGLSHPTWSELVNYLKLPRRPELAESMASEVLRSHGEQSTRLRELNELLSDCIKF